MRERGLTAGGINMYARTINSYLGAAAVRGLRQDQRGRQGV